MGSDQADIHPSPFARLLDPLQPMVICASECLLQPILSTPESEIIP
jgi:hypothetical protein